MSNLRMTLLVLTLFLIYGSMAVVGASAFDTHFDFIPSRSQVEAATVMLIVSTISLIVIVSPEINE